MAIRDVFKFNRRTFFNPSDWIDYDNLKTFTRTIWDLLLTIFAVPRPAKEETFEEATRRLNLSEEDIQNQIKTFRGYAIFFFLLGLLIFIYAFYLIFRYLTFMGFILGLVSSILFFAQAFRFDFWSLQMRKRKLGLTFSDWKESILGNKRE